MEPRLEEKKISGKSYYYYSLWGWKNGRCRRLWQRYLGRAADIAASVEGTPPAPLYAEIFQWGLPMALWQESKRAKIIETVDRLSPKRRQGLTTGEYLAVATINHGIAPRSKRSMWEWFSSTVLMRLFPEATKAALTSQRFWDHMKRCDESTARAIWKQILGGVLEREHLDLSSICYDGTNFYTFIDTFNLRCEIARRGKNKQGRNNLRQVNYALFCCADARIPLYYEVYEGNRNDAGHFSQALGRFAEFFKGFSRSPASAPKSTLIFDKGNNSADNLALVDRLGLDFVGSVKNDEHKELAGIKNDDPCLQPCSGAELEGARAFRTKKKIYNKEPTVVVTFNPALHQAQRQTLENDIAKAIEKLSSLSQRLGERASGRLRGGKPPTAESVRKQCEAALSRPYLKQILSVEITPATKETNHTPSLKYTHNPGVLEEISNTWLGKNILISSHRHWSNERIIRAYRSQFLIEEVYKQMKDRQNGNWWPMNHWTDPMIRVHALYCTIAVLLRGLLLRRVRTAGLELSHNRLLAELDDLCQVISIYPASRGKKPPKPQPVLSRRSELQERLLQALGLDPGSGDV